MLSQNGPRKWSSLLLLLLLAFATYSCTQLSAPNPNTGVSNSNTVLAQNASPLLSAQQIATVRETLPHFKPEQFAPGLNPLDAASFAPGNFMPAFFLGDPQSSGFVTTPLGLPVDLRGFDLPDQPMLIPSDGTYFDRQLNKYSFTLGAVDLVPLHNLESRMQLPLTLNPPTLTVDRRGARIDPNEIDRIMFAVKDSVAMRFPQAMNVDLSRCEIIIEPTIFYVTGTNFGNTWAGGAIHELGNGRYRIRVVVFYINGQRRVADWREFLVHEAINFLVLAIGRADLAQ